MEPVSKTMKPSSGAMACIKGRMKRSCARTAASMHAQTRVVHAPVRPWLAKVRFVHATEPPWHAQARTVHVQERP